MLRRHPPRIGLVTCRVLPEPDADETLLLGALRAAGLHAEMLAWDADGSAGSTPTLADAFDLCIIRSTWNYYHHADAFRSWLRRTAAATRLLNPLAILEWNLHKGYLRDLQRAGVAIVPTAWVDRDKPSDLASLLTSREWTDVVIKPAVSAGSFRTERFTHDSFAAAQRFLEELTACGDVMVQPYLRTVESGGERSLIWIDGELTHAVTKSPRFSDGDECVSTASQLTDDERRFAADVLTKVPGAATLLYARVDTMRADDGRLCLSELELIEPSLFLLQHPPALNRFVDAICKVVRHG